MVQGNSDLKVKEGEISSKPWQWPINYRVRFLHHLPISWWTISFFICNFSSQGQFFSGNNQRIYLLGNPVIWWSNIAFLVIFIALYVHAAVREQRGCDDHPDTLKQRNDMINAGSWLFIGWLLHYVPFWAMTRILYFHHYFPALLYSSMLSGVTLNYILENVSAKFNGKVGNTIYHVCVGSVISIIVYR